MSAAPMESPRLDTPAAAAAAAPAAPRVKSPAARRRAWIGRAKLLITVAALAPAAWLGWRFLHDDLGANPIAEAMNQLGFWALTLLLASLALTPIKLVTGWTWPIAVRRLVGLLAFGYACAHLAMYVGVDQFFDFGDIGRDIVKRKFITVGVAAFCLLVPLAVTSTAGMTKRLGARRWKRLHRLVYVTAALGVVHFVWRVKSDLRQPMAFAAVLAVLLVVRVAAFLRDRRPAGAAPVKRPG